MRGGGCAGVVWGLSRTFRRKHEYGRNLPRIELIVRVPVFRVVRHLDFLKKGTGCYCLRHTCHGAGAQLSRTK